MKISTKLFIAGAVCFALGVILPRKIMPLTVTLTVLCLTGGFILLIVQGIVETINKNKTTPKDYTTEARKACENVTPKRKQENTPPWEG